MSNGAGDIIEDFYNSKAKESPEENSSEEEIPKEEVKHFLILEKVGDLIKVKLNDVEVVGYVDRYLLEETSEISIMEIDIVEENEE